MKKLAALAGLSLLTFGAAARADDPPAKPAAPPAATGTKHENSVSPEAKAAFEKMSKAMNGPLRRGVKEAAGAVTVAMPQGAVTMKFTVKNGAISVEAPGGGDKGVGAGGGGGGGRGAGFGGRGLGRQVETMLGYAIGVFSPSDEVEHDAAIVEKDGKSVLEITTFQNGKQNARRDLTIDANGLPATGSLTTTLPGRDGGAGKDITSDMTYTWTKVGESWRLDKVEATGERPQTVELRYVDVGNGQFPASWKATGQMGSFEFKVSDLVVDGKKVETKAPGEKTKKKGEEDDDGDEDEGHEGHEKGGKDKK